MTTVRELQGKLQSVKNIKKITQAMELVAAARLKRAQLKAETSRPYAQKLKLILDNLIASSDTLTHPLIVEREVKKINLVIIGADRGLSGSYNQSLFSAAEKWLGEHKAEDMEITLVGRRTIDYFKNKKWQVGNKLADWGGKITYHEIEEFTHKLIQDYLQGKTDDVWMIYTHYVNIASRTIKVEKLMSVEHSLPEKVKNRYNTLFEPNVEEIFEKILPRYLVSRMQMAFSEAYASELGARIFSMRAATKNAEEMTEKLTLLRNKIRQAGITRELIEITACVEALK